MLLLGIGPLSVRRHILFLIGHHQVGNFRKPSTFSEKVNWRIINDRRELLRYTCDKLYNKREAEARGVAVATTLWQGRSLKDLAGLTLSERWVLKPNHGSGLVAFGEGPIRDVTPLETATRHWLGKSGPAREGEWAYTQARPLFIVEEMLGTGNRPPTSYKFFVFNGEPLFIAVISVDEERFSPWRSRLGRRWPPPRTAMGFYTSSWEQLDVRLGDFPLGTLEPRPSTLPAMLSAAGKLARDFDFMRVDLFSDRGKVYFGELTPYPSAGLSPFSPREFDVELGSHWTLPRLA
jgi:hypothetical protein